MSRIKSDKINITSSILVDYSKNSPSAEQDASAQALQAFEISKYQAQGEQILAAANAKAEEIIEQARKNAAQIEQEANQILSNAQDEANNLQNEATQNFERSQEEIEILKQNASQEGAKEGYDAGYADGLEKVKEDLAEKISQAGQLAQSGFEMRDKIINSSKAEIVEMISLLAKKLLLNLADKEAVFKTVEKCISLLGEKDEITVVLSKNYADMLNEYASDCGNEFLKNVKISYAENKEDDTILVQNPKERLDASFSSQLDVILEQFKSQLHDVGENQEE